MKTSPSSTSSKETGSAIHFTVKSDTSQLTEGKSPEDVSRMTEALIQNTAFRIELSH